MGSLDSARADIAFLALYLSKAETRDKICRAIQYGSKFISGGEPGPAQQVDKSTSLARKVFRLLKSVNELQGLLTPPPKNTPLALVFLGKSKNALMATFLFLDQLVWAGRTGIYKNKEHTELISKISLHCWMAGCACNSLLEISEVLRLASAINKIDKNLKLAKQSGNIERTNLMEQKLLKLQASHEKLLNFIKASLDIIVAVGLLQLAPGKVTSRATGGFGFITSLISCYQLLPSQPTKEKSK
eukprot:c43130_g1_i1 orf=141-872(+)